ncbi:MAG: diacylglycerol kinase [Deltaproteobacteria bacterium]|nr:diacylglycerol kinase [Deltaproteobacteria bacterium]
MFKLIKNIPRRAKMATVYSLAGLASSFKKEESVRLETLALAILLATMIFVPWPLWKKLALVAAFLLVPLAELVNSAIEDVCDLVSMEYDEKIKNAKDKGSGAVLLAITIDFVVLAALCLAP